MQSFTNQATLTYSGKSVNSNTVTGQIADVLAVAKTAVIPSYTSGDEKTFVVTLVNSGTTALTNLTITDNLGRYEFTPQEAQAPIRLYPMEYIADSIRYFVNGTLQETPETDDTEGLRISGISVPAGGSAVIVYEARITEYAPLVSGGTITNTAAVTGAGLANAVSASEEVTVSDVARLAIIKSVSPKTVTAAGTLTYTFDIQNYGSTATTEDDAVTVSDTFSPILKNISVLYNGTALSTAQYNYNEATGVFSTVPGVITVGAATFTQNPETGAITVTPGTGTLEITGTI